MLWQVKILLNLSDLYEQAYLWCRGLYLILHKSGKLLLWLQSFYVVYFDYRVADEISYVQRTKAGQCVDEGGDHFVDWEKVIDRGSLTLWRKPVPNSYLYEYKGKPTYRSIKIESLMLLDQCFIIALQGFFVPVYRQIKKKQCYEMFEISV